MKSTYSRLKYHYFSVFYTLLGISKIGLLPSIKVLLARYLAGNWDIRPKGYKSTIRLRGKTSDTKLFYDIIVGEEYAIPDFQPDFIIDAGANIGLFSIYFAERFPNTRIIAIEPESGNFSLLSHNTKDYPEVKCICKGLWSSSGRLRIRNPGGAKWAFEVLADPDGDIEAVGLSDILSSYSPTAQNTLVKMDIEGSDVEVFAANTAWLKQVRALYIEVHGSWRQLFRAIDPFMYSIMRRRESLYVLFDHQNLKQNE